MSPLETALIIIIAAAIFFAVFYIVTQHKKHGCVGCSQAKYCKHNWKNCVKTNKDNNLDK